MNVIKKDLRKELGSLPTEQSQKDLSPTQSSAIGIIQYSGLVTGNPNVDAKIMLLSLLARYDS